MTRDRDTRQELLDAGSEEFARYGLSGARIDVIVKRAGVNEAMIYRHFGSKVGFYKAVLASHFRAPELPEAPVKRGAAGEPFFPLLTRFCLALVARPHFLKLVLHEAMGGWKHVPKASLANIPEALRSSFEAAQRKGELRKGCRFEVVYLTAVGALVSGELLAGRFADLRSAKAREELSQRQLQLIIQGARP